MKLFVAPTDFAWYSFLAARKPDEVNFWQPSAGVGFHALDNGDPLESWHLFLFKLKGSINRIAGGGYIPAILQSSLGFDPTGDRAFIRLHVISPRREGEL